MILQFLITLVLIGFNPKENPKETVKISGHLKNFSNRVNVDDISEISDLSYIKWNRELICDKNGFFTISFPLKAPNYFLIGRNVVYLTPGDDLKVTLDYIEPANSKFEGTGHEANNYLRDTPNAKSGSFLKGGLNLKKTADSTIKYLFSLAKQREIALEKVKNVSSTFRELEQVRISADIINSLGYLPGFFIIEYDLKGKAKDDFNKEAQSLIKIAMLSVPTKGLTDARNLKLTVFRKNAYAILSLENKNDSEAEKINDQRSAWWIFYEIDKLTDRDKTDSIHEKINKIKNPIYASALRESFTLKTQLLNNDVAKDFMAINDKLNSVKLSDLKGKIIFIDLWATWCGPCLDILPNFNKIKEKYKNNSKIVFISLCVNDSKATWLNYLSKTNQNGIQWFVEKQEMSDYRVTNLPRTMVIDANFNIVKLYGPDIAGDNIFNYIDNLVK